MALQQTDYYYDYQIDPGLTRRLLRSQLARVGINDDDTGVWNGGYARLWVDDPENPYVYGNKIVGMPTLNSGNQRVEQVNSWQETSAAGKRSLLSDEIDLQIPNTSVTDEVRDSTARAKTEHLVSRAISAHVALDATDDAGLDAFDSSLDAHEIQEPDYAGNILAQETRNLTAHNELVLAGAAGVYEPADVAEIESRIIWNEKVVTGEETGTKTPVTGAQRGDVALDGEAVEDAIFREVTYEWPAGTTRYIPEVVLAAIPAGVDPNFVFAMVYDASNVYRSWMPFVQQPDGTWKTPSDVNYDGIAQSVSSRWRVAVASGGTQSEFEITRRVFLTPPNTATSRVRWGGRNGSVEARRRGRR